MLGGITKKNYREYNSHCRDMTAKVFDFAIILSTGQSLTEFLSEYLSLDLAHSKAGGFVLPRDASRFLRGLVGTHLFRQCDKPLPESWPGALPWKEKPDPNLLTRAEADGLAT